MNKFGEKVSFIWTVADLLRGPYKPAQYGEVMLPLTVLRRLDCVLAPTKAAVVDLAQQLGGTSEVVRDRRLNRAAGQRFHNSSALDLEKIKGAPDEMAINLRTYIRS